MLPAPGFHHLRLNSVDPDAAIDFYVRQFPTSSKTRWSGLAALAAPNDVLILFNRVATAPATSPQSAIWHFGWHVTDARASLESYKSLSPSAFFLKNPRQLRHAVVVMERESGPA